MSVTFIAASDRDLRRGASTARSVGADQLLLAATSLVAVMAIGLAYSGRVGVIEAQVAQREVQVTNLNVMQGPQDLERALEPVFVDVAERRFAAEGLAAFVLEHRRSNGDLPNVGELAQARTPVAAIERTPGLVTIRQRLDAARRAAATRQAAAPTSLTLLTSADLVALKPTVVVRGIDDFTGRLALWGGVYLISFWALAAFWWVRGFRGDMRLLAAAHFLTAIGFAVLLTRPDPLRDTVLFARYVQGIACGIAMWGVVSLLDFRKAAFLTLSYVPLVVALALCAVLLVFGDGPGTGGVKVNLGPVQPIEVIRLLLALFLAGYFARRWELLRQMHTRSIRTYRLPRWLLVPRLEDVMPVLVGVASALLFFFLQKDLGPALLLSCVFLAMYAIARNRVGLALTGLLILVAGFYAGYALKISSTLAGRVEMWRSPWDNAVRGGDQIAQAAWAVSTGGFAGTGLGLGDTRYLPAGHTDLALSAVGEELGFLGVLAVAVVYALIAARGLRVALRSASDYGFFLALGVTLFLTIPVLVMSAGILGVMPLTGVVTPFLSYGGSAMVANFAALGILNAIASHGAAAEASTAFRHSTRALTMLMGGAAVALAGLLFHVQVAAADEVIVRPHLGLHADGVRRFQYNPRVLDLAARIPRGTIHDRAGLVLATSDAPLIERQRERYAKLGMTLDGSCAPPVERCYPLGNMAFHLLGDLRSRANWGATNTSYVERDFEHQLRGFDDHAGTVSTVDASGRSSSTVRRDYRELLPVLHHRHQPEHAAVKTFFERSRDVTLTIDARLQVRLASIVAAHAGKSARQRAAAVVIDPDTGALLALASYPLPQTMDGLGSGSEDEDGGAWLDRARYGLYPPGSTFKLVTAAAALRRDSHADRSSFMCRLLPDGRVGARLPQWGTVRDDVLDTHAHGAITMHQGIARSCNAYFAQLAVQVGPEALLDTAARLGISATPGNSVERLRATLPQAGYGQGDVVATPLRMARVAGAIASQGVLRETRLDARAPLDAQPERIVTATAASRLGQYLREAVLNGTGRSLRGHAWPIAGKTGTAEVAGARSHSWFVGYAPYGEAKKRIAFAVLIEHAGYGGVAAAPAAGSIVTAAADLGLIR